MTDDKVAHIVGGLSAQARMIELAETYDGQPVDVVAAQLRAIIRATDLEPSGFVPEIAQRIVDGRRGQAIFSE